MEKWVIDLAKFICESDAIEGIYDDHDWIVRQIQTRVKKMKKPGQENNWGKGHVGAMLMLESLARTPINQRLDKKLICDVQSLITAEQHKKPGGHKLPEEFVGRYRSGGVKVGSELTGYRICPPPDQVPKLMEELLQYFHCWWQDTKTFSLESNIVQIADFHLIFLMIHPFADGNGRTARALAYFMLVYAGLKPIIFTSGDKHETYYPCFDNPKNFSTIRQYFFSKMGIDSKGPA